MDHGVAKKVSKIGDLFIHAKKEMKRMKDCQIYYKCNCTCTEDDCCYENDGSCPYMVIKEKCKNCKKDILKCYECK
jgi:hypothetical protein